MRPASIILFERLYGVAILAGLIANCMALYAAMRVGLAMGMIFRAILFTVFNIGLWYFISRRASVVAKWIFVVLIALATAGVGVAIYYHLLDSGLAGMLAAITITLELACVILLFRRDAQPWFRKEHVA